MSDFGDSELDRDERRRVAAAEYALGVTDGEARAAMERAMDASPALAAEVAYWERRLAAFNEDYLPATPSAELLGHIEARLFAEGDARKPWYDSLLVWRALAGTAAAIAVLAVGLNLLAPGVQQPSETNQLVAALQPVDSDISFLARYDPASQTLRVSGTGAPAGSGNDYELWFIEGEEAPISMGVVAMGEAQGVVVDEALRDRLAQDITLAVTREIAGGSPTGTPQGPIVAAGPLAAI
ncbi:anti-sigma factor [Pelagibacterium mangrovi]|uniref:anti-sigma factor n=1 Tax=Pelagibacterium mangrovi TaxID=3119828 RepID=UPI002FC5D0B2